MESVKYLSIAEFAEAAKVSKQAIYKQINNENSQLYPYILREGKRTLISISALSELYKVDIENLTLSTQQEANSTLEVENSTQQSAQQVDKVEEKSTPIQPNSNLRVENSTPKDQPISTDYIEYLKAEIKELKADKAQQEQRFNDTLKEKDAIIKQQTEQLANLAQQVADIANKALITTSQQQYLTAAEKAEKQEPQTEETPIQQDPPKKSFFDWLLGK